VIDETAALARPAATVVLVRPGPRGLEVLLVERPSTMSFAPGLHAFPGGALDAGDSDPELAERSALTPDELAASFGGILTPAEALATAIAAIRELFEETGILLADATSPGGVPPGYLARARTGLLDGSATAGSMASFLDLRLRTDLLAPLSRWVTPPAYERRFDARFFVAQLPRGADPVFAPGEIAGHRWLTPRAALDSRAAGVIALWPPTSTTLQQLEHVRSYSEVVGRLAPRPPVDRWNEALSDTLTRIALPSAGGVPGQSVNAYLIGRRELVLVDPGDPSESAALAIREAMASREGHVRAIILTHADPDHAAGALGLAEELKVPILVGPGGGHDLPFDVVELADREPIDRADVLITVVATPGHRPDHVSLVLDGTGGPALIAGDVVGRPASATIVGPLDRAAQTASVAHLADFSASLLVTGHDEPVMGPGAVQAVLSVATPRAGSGGG
jgi:glyoxylase-like metal-dependent hydrolase (beta-lactamase superfamily II)/8-oxo-dGTP pyrophosphatase MutT (NUDIX family)